MTRMTSSEFLAMRSNVRAQYKAPQAKYRNVKTTIDGFTFDSKAEADRYQELKLMLQAGVISGFARQPSFLVSREVRYRPDFIVCNTDGRVWVEDVKGVETDTFKVKAKLFREKYPWLELRIVR